MSKKILIINGKQEFLHSKGKLNQTMTDVAESFLKENNCTVKVTNIDTGYDVQEEIQKYIDSDVLIYQYPVWWMGTPWKLKKYIDEVLTYGHSKLYSSDGRSRSDPKKQYGSGGLLKGKQYMLSVTWNAPIEAFIEKDNFFEGVGVDAVHIGVHKANQFLAMTPIPTYICNDVMKDPKVEVYIKQYKEHLLKYIIS